VPPAGLAPLPRAEDESRIQGTASPPPRQRAPLARHLHLATPAPSPAGDPARAKQVLSDTISRFRLDISRSGDSDADKSSKLQHLEVLERRAGAQLEKLSANLGALYGSRHDVGAVLNLMLETIIARGLERPGELKALDAAREHDPGWFSTHKSIAGSLYVDVHCGTLDKLHKEISLFKLLNVNMLHLMPTIYKTPEENNDGGYAISDFRSLNPKIGTMDELRELFNTLRKNGISPIMDITINHIADDHEWARAAKAGDPEKRDFFILVNEAQKEEYDRTVPITFKEIFPSNFTWNAAIGSHLWTSFMSTQWDLNYKNPKVLAAMAGEMMFLLNQGTDILRMDAVPFLWKEPGTKCKSLPEVQPLVGVFNAVNRIAAPGAVLLSEAITAPEDTTRYLGTDKCQMAYNAMCQAYLWDALSHEDTSHLAEVLRRHGNAPEGTTFLNIVRTHDNAIFEFDVAAARDIGIDDAERQKSLKEFFISGKTYATGFPFGADPDPAALTFVNGTTGSLAGLEKAVKNDDKGSAEQAIRRIKLLKSVQLAMPGVPIVNLSGGDDRGQLNDYSFKSDAVKSRDARWTNRVPREIDFSSKSPLEIESMDEVFSDTVALNRIRTGQMPAFGTSPMHVIDTGAAPVLGFTRKSEEQSVLVLANFSASPQKIEPERLLAHSPAEEMVDKIDPQGSQALAAGSGIELAPYQCMWLVPAERKEASALAG
jgi:amylosucrase